MGEATRSTTIPPGVPPNHLFVPEPLRDQVIHWGHASLIFCHPGVRRTLFRIQECFGWPSIKRDIREYIAACTICAQNKNTNATPSGLLQPLPVSRCPWSHISLDSITGLPLSSGNTVILNIHCYIVDTFSKVAWFIPLPKLPSAKETAQVMLTNVFRVHSLPRTVLSNWGPQFLAHFWFLPITRSHG